MSYEMNSTQPNTGYGGNTTAYQGYQQDVEAQQHLVKPAGHSGGLDFHDFLAQVSNIQGQISQLSSNVSRIAALHNQTLSSYDSGSSSTSAQLTAQLETLVAETSILNNHLRDDIKFLERDSKYPGDPQGPQKKQQVDVLKKSFDAELKNYQLMESQYRGQYRTQMERQYRIVKPDATAEEIEHAVSSGETQIFSQAIMSSGRASNAQSTLGAVQARHAEIQRIERTLVELVQLFEEMAREVEAAEPIIEKIEDQTIYAHDELVKGNTELGVAKKHAWNTRRNKWICLGIVVVILIIIVGSIAGSIAAKNRNNNNNSAA